MTKAFSYRSPLGDIALAEENGAITKLVFGGGASLKGKFTEEETPIIKEAYTQLAEFFEGRRERFDLPLAPAGTAFEKKVWEALTAIPYGATRTYGEVAAAVGNPKASRAVGAANNRNPLAIFIPCHRVIGAGGKLVGYAGGLETKKYLLQLEQGQADSGLFGK